MTKIRFESQDQAIQWCLDKIAMLQTQVNVLKENNETLVYRLDKIRTETAKHVAFDEYLETVERMERKYQSLLALIEKIQKVHGR